KKFILYIALIVTIIISNGYILSLIDISLEYLLTALPSLERVLTIFTNIDSAVSESGSGRSVAWNTSIEIIKLSPLIGIGIANYIQLSTQFFGVGNIAHNTYLQLLAEWGMPLALLFLSYVFLVITKALHYKANNMVH